MHKQPMEFMVKEQVITEHAVIYFRVIPLYTVMENRFNTYISSLCRKQVLSLQNNRKRYNIFHFTGHVAAVFKLWNSFPFSDQSEIIFLRHRKGQENYFQTRRKFSLMLFIFPIFNRKSEMRRLVHSEEMRT